MKAILLAAALLVVGHSLTAQPPKTASPQPLKKVLTLKMPKTADDDMPGTRGACVAWHPLQKKYYAVFAGNAAYPQAVFDDKGKRLSSDDQSAFIDTRGLWYDPVKKLVMGNGYDEGGWFSYVLDSKGLVEDYKPVLEGMYQPSEQSVGAYNPAAKQVLFLNGSLVYFYNETGTEDSTLQIHWSRTKADGPAEDEEDEEEDNDYNYTTVVYTGIKGSELGFLNATAKQIELYDIKTGFLTKKLPLENDAKAEKSFNFAYANGTYWLFDMAKREWNGYK